MPVLGSGGRVIFKRPTPVGCELQPEDFIPSCNAFNINCPGLWNGDLVCVKGLPTLEGGIPSIVAGYASYFGSKLFVGPNRIQIDSDNDQFYKNDLESYPEDQFGDDADFYARNGVGGVPEEPGEQCYWVSIDALGRIRFYEDRCRAIAGCPDNAIQLADFPLFESLTLMPPGMLEYQNAKYECLFDDCFVLGGDYLFSDVQDQVTSVSICKSAPEYDFPVAGADEYGNADVLPRGSNAFPVPQALCNVREFTLNLDAPAIDTTLVGEKFGENIKSLVNGGGSFEFFIDRACMDEDKEEVSWMLLNLLMLTEGGASGNPIETEAWFYLYDNGTCNSSSCFPPLGGSLYYKANILITQTAINVRPTEVIAGTAEFVTTGVVRLLQAP